MVNAPTHPPTTSGSVFGSWDLNVLQFFREITSQTVGDDDSASVYQREVVQLATNVSLLFR
jgi:hypothetical protein